MQLENGHWNLEDNVNFNNILTNPYMMQPEDGLWNPEDNDIFTDMFMMQPAIARDGTAPSFSNYINNLAAIGVDSGGYTDATIPRGDGAMEQVQALFTHPFQMADNNIEPQQLPGNTIPPEKGQDEPEYVKKGAPKNPGPSLEEWQMWRPEIYSLYVVANYTLEVTRKEMEKKGFYAGSVTLLLFPPEYYADIT
jgi:hypothetical protein